MDTILVVNAGSSSVKFQVFETDGKSALKRLIKGQMDGIGVRPRLRAAASDGAPLIDAAYAPERVADAAAALALAGAWLRETQQLEPIAVGHRVVHGGPRYDRPVLVGRSRPRRSRTLRVAGAASPAEQPRADPLAARPLSRAPQVACFDTAFHRGHDALADHYAIPERLYDEGVRRYGFHGLSYEFIAPARGRSRHRRRPRDRRPSRQRRVDVRAVGRRSVESTMGFTALDGLPMGTRPGQLDPGVVLYLIQEISRLDFYAAAIAIGGVLLLGILQGILLAALASMLMLLINASRPHVALLGRIPGTNKYSDLARHPENEALPGVIAFRPEASLIYVNADAVLEAVLNRLAGHSDIRLVVCDLSASPYLDLAGSRMLHDLHNELAARGAALRIVGAHGWARDLLRSDDMDVKVGGLDRVATLDDLLGSELK